MRQVARATFPEIAQAGADVPALPHVGVSLKDVKEAAEITFLRILEQAGDVGENKTDEARKLVTEFLVDNQMLRRTRPSRR